MVAADSGNVVVERRLGQGEPGPIEPVAAIGAIVTAYNALAAPVANRVIGRIEADIPRRTDAAGESALGRLIADAQLRATRGAEQGGAVVAFMNLGGIRADLRHAGSEAGEGDGRVTYGELFKVQPFGNGLVVKTFTGAQLYEFLEQQWAANQPAAGNILQVSEGLSYAHTFVPGVSPLGGRYVCEGSVAIGGVPVERSGRYRVALNAFLADGGNHFTVFRLGTEQSGGDLDVDATEAYFAAHSSVAPSGQPRIRRVADCR